MYIQVSIDTLTIFTIVLAATAIVTTLIFLGGIWLWKHLRPERRFRVWEIHILYFSLMFLTLNGIALIMIPQYFVDALVKMAPIWIVVFLGTPVVRHFLDGKPSESDIDLHSQAN